MTTIPIEQAQAELPTLIGRLTPGEEVVITKDDQPVARLIATPLVAAQPGDRQLGTMRGTVLSMSPDFDAPLDEFKEYRG